MAPVYGGYGMNYGGYGGYGMPYGGYGGRFGGYGGYRRNLNVGNVT